MPGHSDHTLHLTPAAKSTRSCLVLGSSARDRANHLVNIEEVTTLY